MGSLRQKSFFIGDWKVSPTEGLLLRGDDVVHIEPKAMELLVYLAKRQGEVVTREDIEKDVWGGTLVSYDSITSTVIKLRKALQDNAREPDYIATIPKRGYELIASVDEQEDPGANEGTQSIGLQHTKKPIWYFLLAGFLVVAVGAALFVMSASVDPVVTDESNVSTISKEKIAQQPLETPSIAVLPFVNMSGDPEQEYFSDGISEDIITDLSRLKNVAVIARNSTFSYKGTVTTTKDIANALNVSHVLEGSVRRSDDRVRITAQLIDVSNGQHIWADRYDRELHDVFAVQDEITKQIVAALTLRLHDGENETIVHPTATNNFEAYDLFLKGLSMYYNYSDESLQNSVELFREAINLDPEFSRAYASLAVSLMRQAFAGHTSHPVETRKRSYELAHKAVSLDPNSPHALWALGFVYMHRRQFEDSIVALEKAISISPQYAEAYSLLALVNNNLGNADEAIRLIETGMELNPDYTWDYLFNLGRAYYTQGDYKNAVKHLERAIERNPNVAPLRVFLAASYVNLDRIGDAEWQIVELEMQHPNSSLSHWENTFPISSKERINKLLNDLRSAGMKE